MRTIIILKLCKKKICVIYTVNTAQKIVSNGLTSVQCKTGSICIDWVHTVIFT